MLGALALALVAAATVEAGYRVVRFSEVIALAREGVSDRTIISFLDNRELDFVVGTDEILRLRDAGVGEEVIRYLVRRTAPRDRYASDPYAGSRYDDYASSPYGDYDGSPYAEPYGGAYLEYGPSYGPSYYVGASIGPYYGYDRYYRGGFGGWLSRTFGFGHYSRGYYSRGYYSRGGSYGSRFDRGRSFGRSYSYSYRSNPGRGYRVTYGGSSNRGYHGGGRNSGGHAVPRGGGHNGGGGHDGGRGHSGGHGRH